MSSALGCVDPARANCAGPRPYGRQLRQSTLNCHPAPNFAERTQPLWAGTVFQFLEICAMLGK
jgi:hypothetical protein